MKKFIIVAIMSMNLVMARWSSEDAPGLVLQGLQIHGQNGDVKRLLQVRTLTSVSTILYPRGASDRGKGKSTKLSKAGTSSLPEAGKGPALLPDSSNLQKQPPTVGSFKGPGTPPSTSEAAATFAILVDK